MSNETLFNKYGGAETVRKLVEAFYKKVLADTLLAPYFKNTDMVKQHQHQAMFIGAALGSTENYTGRDMKAAHVGLGITKPAFDKVVELLVETLTEAGVEQSDIAAIGAKLAPIESEVVEA